MGLGHSTEIKTLNDARIQFGGHSYFGPLIKACDSAPNREAKANAMRELVQSLKHMTSADVSVLEAEVKAAVC